MVVPYGHVYSGERDRGIGFLRATPVPRMAYRLDFFPVVWFFSYRVWDLESYPQTCRSVLRHRWRRG